MATNSGLLEKALKSAGGQKGFEQKYQQHKRSLSYIDTDRKELLKSFDRKWIAVYNCEVVAHGKDYDDIEEQLNSRNIPIEEVVIEFLSSEKIMTLF